MIPFPDEQEWRLQAACRYSKREQHSDLAEEILGKHWALIDPLEWISQWFGEKGREPYRFARTICETRCPVFEECESFALSGFDAGPSCAHGLIAGRAPVDRFPRGRDQRIAAQRIEAMRERRRKAWEYPAEAPA